MDCTLAHISKGKRRWEKATDKGLYTTGSDFGFLQAVTQRKNGFLLPSSPSFIVNAGIVIFSFPSVKSFLQDARSELLQGQLPRKPKKSMWKTYRPAMEKDIYDAGEGAENDEDTIKMLKERLLSCFKEFDNEFLVLVASVGVGKIRYIAENRNCVGNNASVLPGSSGGPICPLQYPGYFVGIHSGGSPHSDMNVATSTDNPEFVEQYMSNVLPRFTAIAASCR